MEEISSRRSSNDDYGGSFSNSLMEPTVHDVMSLELSHHSLGDSYLDPRSFGDGSSFEEFGGNSEGRYDMGPSGYDQAAPPPSAPPPPARTAFGNHNQHQQSGIPRRFEQGCPPPVLQRSVPTYPVKTADPSTCTQYAPVRTMSSALKPPSRRSSSSRSSQKKEPMDPKTVEDEVARNVSQILSATKQQKLAQEAQQRCGIFPPVSKINFSCSDCGKAMTSHRNLQPFQRHRQSSCCKKVGEWVDRSQCWPEQWNDRDRLSEDSDSLPGMGGHSLPHSSFSSESSGWCSPNNSYSPSNQMAALDPANLAPLSLDTDDSQTHSSSASHCSSASNGTTTFTCESCKKSVCSLRSLKRHQTTCKQYIQEFGPPPESDVPRMRPLRRLKVVLSPESRSESPESPRPVRTLRAPPESAFAGRSAPLTLAAADSTQDDEGVPKQSAAHTTCSDCNRQLCSASNLKRHRATCKMALNKSESPSQSSPLPTNYSHVEIPARERSIIDRSYAAAVAASEQMRVQSRPSQPPHPPQPPPERPRQQYTAYIVTSPRQKPQPWVTVGEHLRAKHVQQRMMEAASVPKHEDSSVVPSSNQSFTSDSSNSHVKMEEKPLKSESHEGLKELAPRSERAHHTHQHLPPPRASEPAAEIPPLDSIITTQPLSGDRLSGIPVLVHDSRQTYTSSRQPPAQNTEFQCPECKKTYSCRKNVKRHRMAVHKLSADDISRFPGPTPCNTAVMVDSPQLSPSLPARMLVVPRVDPKAEFKTETVPLATTTNPKEQRTFEQQQRFQKFTTPQQVDNTPWRQQSRDFIDEEESTETARIAAELKRSAEMEIAELAEFEEKKSRPELAEADTTFNEETDLSRSQHSSPGTVSTATGPLPPLSSWMGSKPLSVEVPYGSSRSEANSPLTLKRPCLDNRGPMLSDGCTEDSLSTGDPMLGHGPSSAPRTLDDDCWFKKEEVPDSTTSQRADRSTSPCILMDHAEAPALGSLPYTRKRALSGGSIPAAFLNDPKQARHLCQDCGKFYSSEWNLERHRRESCPTKTNQASPPAPPNDDISVLMGSMRFVLSRAALTRASASFAQLFNVHDPAKGELRLEGDPLHFQMLLDVYNNPANLTEENIDCVANLAAKYKFAVVTDSCSKFILEELPKTSVMHAIRLAEHHKMTSIKQRLFDSISIDVFRSLAADHDYKLMNAELKAELLEKWGTFL